MIAEPPPNAGAFHDNASCPSPATTDNPDGAPGGPLPGAAPSIITPKRCRTVSIGFPMVSPSPPAKRSATGWLPLWVTIREPESPAALKVPGEIEIWLTKRACWKHVLKRSR